MVMKTGGLGAPRAKDEEVEEAVKNVKPVLEEKTNTKYDSIEIISYKSQLVAGKNYFVKVSDTSIQKFNYNFYLDDSLKTFLLFELSRSRLNLLMESRALCT